MLVSNQIFELIKLHVKYSDTEFCLINKVFTGLKISCNYVPIRIYSKCNKPIWFACLLNNCHIILIILLHMSFTSLIKEILRFKSNLKKANLMNL